MADDWFDIDKIKIAMKKAAGEPIPFAFGVAMKAAECKLAMYIKRDPAFLLKVMKKEGFKPAKIIVGTARTEGALLIVTCEAEVPNAKKFIKLYLKETPLLQKKVQLMGPNGELDADDADDEAQEAVAAAPAAQDETGPDPRLETLRAATKELAGQIGAIADTAVRAKMAAAFKKIVEVVNRGDADTAEPALEKLKVMVARLLEGGGTASPQADALGAEWNKRLKEIAPQIKEVLTAKLEGSREIALKFKEAQGFAGKKDLESAIATLDEVSKMIDSLTNAGKELEAEWTQRVKKLAPQIKDVLTAKLEGSRDVALKFKEAQGLQSKQDYASAIATLDEVSAMIENLTSAGKKLEGEWAQRLKKLQPDLDSVLQQGLGDPSKLQAARDMALDKAGNGDYATALKILDRLQPAVAQALAGAKLPGEDEQAEVEKSDTQAETRAAETAAETEGFAAYARRFAAIEGSYDRVIKAIPEGSVKNELRKQMDWANAGVEKEDYKAAIAALDKLEGMLSDAVDRASEEEARRKADSVFTFDFRKALLEFARVKDSVNATLQKFVIDTKSQLPEQASLASAIQDLVYELNDELYDEVDEALGTSAVNAAEYYKNVRKVIDQYRGHIRGNDIIKHLDQKPVAFGIGKTLISALDKLDKAIAA